MWPTGSDVNVTYRVCDVNVTYRKLTSMWHNGSDANVTYRKWRQCDLPEVTSMWPTGSDVNVPGGELPGRHPVLLSVEDVGAAAWAGAGGRRRRHRRTGGQCARGGGLLRARHSVHARQALHPLPLNKNKNRFNGYHSVSQRGQGHHPRYSEEERNLTTLHYKVAVKCTTAWEIENFKFCLSFSWIPLIRDPRFPTVSIFRLLLLR